MKYRPIAEPRTIYSDVDEWTWWDYAEKCWKRETLQEHVTYRVERERTATRARLTLRLKRTLDDMIASDPKIVDYLSRLP